MPAYFSICFECEKKKIYKDLVHDFCQGLLENGFAFLSGYWGYEEDSLADIITWNQRKLEENFQLDRAEHHSHGYKQLLFSYGDFSEVRLFLLNFREEERFSFVVIIPEDELISWKKGVPDYDGAKIDRLVQVCERMWQQPYVGAIQTELELSDPVPQAEEIRDGAAPGVEPFAILPKAVWESFREKKDRDVAGYTCESACGYTCAEAAGDGVVLRLLGRDERCGADQKDLKTSKDPKDSKDSKDSNYSKIEKK